MGGQKKHCWHANSPPPSPVAAGSPLLNCSIQMTSSFQLGQPANVKIRRCAATSPKREAKLKWGDLKKKSLFAQDCGSRGFPPHISLWDKSRGGVSSWKTAGGRGAVCSAEKVHTILVTWVRKTQGLSSCSQVRSDKRVVCLNGGFWCGPGSSHHPLPHKHTHSERNRSMFCPNAPGLLLAEGRPGPVHLVNESFNPPPHRDMEELRLSLHLDG